MTSIFPQRQRSIFFLLLLMLTPTDVRGVAQWSSEFVSAYLSWTTLPPSAKFRGAKTPNRFRKEEIGSMGSRSSNSGADMRGTVGKWKGKT